MEYILAVVNYTSINVYFLVIGLTGAVNVSGAADGHNLCRKIFFDFTNILVDTNLSFL